MFRFVFLLNSNIDSLPVVANWVPYISFIRWSFQAFVTNEFEDSSISCTAKDISEGQCITDGNQVIRNYFGANHSISYPLMGQFILILVFLTIAYLFLISSRIRYIRLGHVGSKVKLIKQVDIPSDSITKKSTSSFSPTSSQQYSFVNSSTNIDDTDNNNNNDDDLTHDHDNVKKQQENSVITPHPDTEIELV